MPWFAMSYPATHTRFIAAKKLNTELEIGAAVWVSQDS